MSEHEVPSPLARRRSPLESHLVFGLLLASFFAAPLTYAQGELGELALQLFYQVLLFVTLLTTARRRWILAAGLTLLVLSIVCSFLPLFGAEGDRQLVSSLLGVGVLLIVVALSIARMLRAREVDARMLSGSASVFLLLGILWSLSYNALELRYPGSFAGLQRSGAANQWETLGSLHYFSFTTLTTLGYGDIVPRTPMARALTNLEAIVGQLFLVVMVARLVALQTASASQRRRD